MAKPKTPKVTDTRSDESKREGDARVAAWCRRMTAALADQHAIGVAEEASRRSAEIDPEILAVREYLLVPVIGTQQWRIARLIAEERWQFDPEIFDNFEAALQRVPARRGRLQ